MAAFTNYPSPYTSAKQPVVLTLTAEPGEIVEVGVNGYYKQLSALTRTVNIAPYYKGEFSIQPLDEKPTSYTIVQAEDCGRVVYGSASVDNENSTPLAMSYADNILSANCFLTELKKRKVTRDSSDELSVYATKALTVKFGDVVVDIEPGFYSMQFKPSYFAEEANSIVVLLYDGDALLDQVIYTLVHHADTQLAWINTYGVVDIALFSELSTQTAVDKEAIYLNSGYMNTNVTAENTATVISSALPRLAMKSLSYIFKSSGVWVKSSSEWKAVDVISSNAVLYDRDSLSAITIEYRAKTRV